jgi:CheY-like chemotaxis protein
MARILVIDDDAASRAAFRRLLTQSGYDVMEAANGKEGLQCLAEGLPDVLLVDIFMPEQDGIETIRRVRQAFPHVPIVALSGGGSVYREGDVLTAARDFGARYTFTKPCAPEELLAALQAVTNS